MHSFSKSDEDALRFKYPNEATKRILMP